MVFCTCLTCAIHSDLGCGGTVISYYVRLHVSLATRLRIDYIAASHNQPLELILDVELGGCLDVVGFHSKTRPRLTFQHASTYSLLPWGWSKL